MKRHYLKILSISFLILVLLSSCGGGGAGSSSSSAGGSSSMVSLTVGGSGQTASLRIEKNTLFAQAQRWFNDMIKTDEVIAGIPSDVSRITFTISAPDITTISKTDAVSGQSSITETFSVSNGNNRLFAITAYNASGTAVYTGSTNASLNGSAVTLNITMATALATYAVGTNPVNMAIDSSGNVWVTNIGANTVTELNSSGALLGTFTVGNNPRGIHIDSSGNVWITNYGSNTVTELSSTGTLLGTFTVGTGPWGIARDSSGNMWVANY